MNFEQSVQDSLKKTQYKWLIENFNDYFEFVDDRRSLTISSGEFMINSCSEYTFFFKMTFFAKSFSCSLYRYPKTRFLSMAYRLWLKTGDKYWENKTYILDYNENSSEALATLAVESNDLLAAKSRKDLFYNLTVVGEFIILKDHADIQPIHPLQPCQSIKDDFRKLLKSENNSDIVCKVDGKKFNVHKSILSARSPVFAAMFQHDMLEKIMSTVTIEDISESTFKLFLEFIYTDEIKNKLDVEMGLSLLEAACKYQLNGLQNLCEIKLLELITTENAEKIRYMADLLGLTNFMASLDTFLKLHPKQT